MNGKNVNFGVKKIKKSDFYKKQKNNQDWHWNDIDVNKILVSKEEPYATKNSFKYFVRYNDSDVIRPLCIKLLQMTGYVRKLEGNTAMSFKINSKQQLLKKYHQIWKRVEKLLKIEIDRMEECKYEKEKIKMENLIDDDWEKSSSDESDNDSNDETEFDNDEYNE